MGKSFFNDSTDAQLALASRAFAAQISQSPATYGISEEQAQAYVMLDAEWQAAYRDATSVNLRTPGKVVAKNELRRRLTAMASNLAKIIAGNPAVTDEQRLGLGLSVRAKPSPLPPPGVPSGFAVKLDGDGSLVLKWKCNNPPGSRGTQYQIWRRIGEGDFIFLDQVGEKRYRDYTLPPGATGIVYRIRAVRSTKRGEWAMFPVNVGGGRPNPVELAAAA